MGKRGKRVSILVAITALPVLVLLLVLGTPWAIEAWQLSRLDSPDERVWLRAASALKTWGTERAILPLLLKYRDGRHGPPGAALDISRRTVQRAVPALVQALESNDSGVQHGATWVLGQLGPEALPGLVVALKHPDDGVRESGTAAAWSILLDDEAGMELLLRELSAASPEARKRLMSAFCNLARPDMTIEMLRPFEKGRDPTVSHAARLVIEELQLRPTESNMSPSPLDALQVEGGPAKDNDTRE